MAFRLFLTAICVVLAPLSAAAGDDYERKDYRDSYERHYEKRGQANNSPAAAMPQADASYDEYSLYEWSRQRKAKQEEASRNEHRNNETYGRK